MSALESSVNFIAATCTRIIKQQIGLACLLLPCHAPKKHVTDSPPPDVSLGHTLLLISIAKWCNIIKSCMRIKLVVLDSNLTYISIYFVAWGGIWLNRNESQFPSNIMANEKHRSPIGCCRETIRFYTWNALRFKTIGEWKIKISSLSPFTILLFPYHSVVF